MHRKSPWNTAKTELHCQFALLNKLNDILWTTILIINPLSANPTKWSNTLKQLLDNSRRIVWVCLVILWGWRLRWLAWLIQNCFLWTDFMMILRNSLSLNFRMFQIKMLYQYVKDSFAALSVNAIKNFNMPQKNSVNPKLFHPNSYLLLTSTSLTNL